MTRHIVRSFTPRPVDISFNLLFVIFYHSDFSGKKASDLLSGIATRPFAKRRILKSRGIEIMLNKDPFLRFSEALKMISINRKPSKHDVEARFRGEFDELYKAFSTFRALAKEGLAGSAIRIESTEYDTEEHSVCVELTAYAPLGERTTIFFVFMDEFVFTQSETFNANHSGKKIARWKSYQISDLVGKLSDFFVDFYKTTVPHFSGGELSDITGRRPLPRSRV